MRHEDEKRKSMNETKTKLKEKSKIDESSLFKRKES